MVARRLIAATDSLAAACGRMAFGAPMTHVYHPLVYAREPHCMYLQKFAAARKRVLFVGINPGPWGMAQTGIPFGEVAAVRDWMGIRADVVAPADAHPRRPVQGFDCVRSEASGRRLWGFFARRFGTAAAFFADHLVLNYCPLLFSSIGGGRCVNLTPDKLAPSEREPLFAACDNFMREAADILRPQFLVGVGGFAQKRLELLGCKNVVVGNILHPSPASPAANRGFEAAAEKQLRQLGVWQ